MHAPSTARYEVMVDDAGLNHRVAWQGITADYRMDYAIGSGRMGHSYLYLHASKLFQSPVSYYTAASRFGPSPGYELKRVPDFERVITPECLSCHASATSPLEDLKPISCERCHGDPSMHLRKPSAGSIVNPSRLSAAARDSVCEQCHLSGEARILNPGKRFQDFRPGELLESVWTVYVDTDRTVSAQKVAGHSEELASSQCFRRSDSKLWCGTCHNPHYPVRDSISWHRERCQACHSITAKTHFRVTGDCVSCHMPKRKAGDVPHTAVTDHRIRRRPSDESQPRALRRLLPWRPPEARFANRNLGLAYIGAWERLDLPDLLDKGFKILAEARREIPADPALLTALGSALLRTKAIPEAVSCLRDAARIEGSARSLMNLAVALEADGQPESAIGSFEAALSMDATIEEAYYRLGELHRRLGNMEQVRGVAARWTAAFPKGFGAKLAGRRWGVAVEGPK